MSAVLPSTSEATGVETRDDAYYISRAHRMIQYYGDCPQAALPGEAVAFHLALRLEAANKRINVLITESIAAVHDRLAGIRQREITDAEVIAAQAVIAALAPYNMELRHDGTEDPQAAAYVQGVQAAHDSMRAALEAARGSERG